MASALLTQLRAPTFMVAGLLCGVTIRLSAEPSTLTRSGALNQASGGGLPLLLGFTAAPGDPFTFRLIFDPGSAPDQSPADPNFGRYFFGTGSATATLG